MSARIAWLLVLAVACGGGRSEPQAGASRRAADADDPRVAAQAEAAREDFAQPGADGWGRAAGLRYLERRLGGAAPEARVPLVIMIHGLGDQPRYDWFRGAEAVTVPMRLIMPEAPTPYHGGFAWFPFRIGDNDPHALARGIASAADGLARAIALLRERRPTTGLPIVTGFSQGGMLSYALALRHPAQVAKSHPISGMLPEPLWPASKPDGARFPRIVAQHGDADDIVPIEPARRLHERLRALGYDAELREQPGVRHQITDAMDAYTVSLLDAAARELSAAR